MQPVQVAVVVPCEDEPARSHRPQQTPPSVESEAEKDILIERLKREVEDLKAQVQAHEELAAEEAAMKAQVKADKSENGAKSASALMEVLGEGRRVVSKGSKLTEKECVGLELGTHFELVEA